jgi:Lrp/AsnC family transcriptional regulator for asnA, asnC and gidA
MSKLLDNLDKRILLELECQTRVPYSIIAKRIGISKQVLGKRIERLKKEGILLGFWTVMDYHRLGYECATLCLKLNIDPSALASKINSLCKMSNIGWLATCYGKWDLILAIFHESFYELNEDLIKIFKIFKNNLVEYSLFENVENYSFSFRMFFPEKTNLPTFHSGLGEKLQLSPLENRIIQALSKDARGNLVDLSEKVHTSIPTIKKHISGFIKDKIILGFRPNLSFSKLGFTWNTVSFKIDKTQENKIINYFKNCPNITFISRCVGDFMNVDLLSERPEDFNRLINKFRTDMPHIIKSFETSIIIETKINFNFLPRKIKIKAAQK